MPGRLEVPVVNSREYRQHRRRLGELKDSAERVYVLFYMESYLRWACAQYLKDGSARGNPDAYRVLGQQAQTQQENALAVRDRLRRNVDTDHRGKIDDALHGVERMAREDARALFEQNPAEWQHPTVRSFMENSTLVDRARTLAKDAARKGRADVLAMYERSVTGTRASPPGRLPAARAGRPRSR